MDNTIWFVHPAVAHAMIKNATPLRTVVKNQEALKDQEGGATPALTKLDKEWEREAEEQAAEAILTEPTEKTVTEIQASIETFLDQQLPE